MDKRIPSQEDVAKMTLTYFGTRAIFIITIWMTFMAFFLGVACCSVLYLESKIDEGYEKIKIEQAE